MPQQTSSMVLRLFGPTRTRVTAIMKQAADKGCPGLNLLMKDGEFAVCVTARADTEELAAQECTRWEHYFRQKMGQAIFSMDEHGLEETTLKTLMEKQKLFVAADEVTGRILNGHLTAGPLADAVYDFGKQSYDNPKFSNKIRPDKKLTRKYPGQLLQQAAGIAQSARRESDADWSVLYHPKDETTPAFVLLCDKKEVCVRVLPASAHPDNLASSWMLDMLRRMALNYAMEPEVESFQYGDPAPCLLPQVAEEPEQPDVAADPEKPRLKSHAEALYDDDPDEEMEPLHCRTHWGRLILCMLIVAAVVAGAFYWKHQWGRQPVAGVMIGRATYGTADFDTEAGQLLSSAQSRQEGVVAYLALPQMPGALVYGPGVSPGQTSGPVAYADQDSLVRCGAQVQPGQSRANFLVSCPETAMKQLSGLDDQDRLAQNSGFTLYTEQETYRYKTAAVFYWDPAETGEAALDLEGLQQLDNYQDYLTFVLGIKARSLFLCR